MKPYEQTLFFTQLAPKCLAFCVLCAADFAKISSFACLRPIPFLPSSHVGIRKANVCRSARDIFGGEIFYFLGRTDSGSRLVTQRFCHIY